MTSHVWQEKEFKPASYFRVTYYQCDRCRSKTKLTIYHADGKITPGKSRKFKENWDGDCDSALVKNIHDS